MTAPTAPTAEEINWENISDEATTTDKRKIADAAGQVRVAQAKLDEVRSKENATAAQLLAAEEKLAATQRRLDAAQQTAASPDNDSSDDKTGKPSAASQLVELALERYGFGVTDDDQPYAVQPGRHVVRMLRGGKNSLRAELSKEFYKQHQKVPAQQALADAMLVLDGMAQDRTLIRFILGLRKQTAPSGSTWAIQPKPWSKSTRLAGR
jgi:hypothetical protein